MKIVVIEPLGVETSLLEELAAVLSPKAELVCYDTRSEDTEELIRRGADADIIALANQQIPEEVITGWKQAKMIAVAFTGVDHIPLETCRKKNITVCNCAGYSTAAVSNLVFGMLISLYRNLESCGKGVRDRKTKDGLIGFELEGKNFGVIGTGAIGTRVLSIAQAFGCKTYAYSRTEKEIEGVTYTDLETLLSTCDIVSVHVPLTNETRGMLNAENLKLMKPSAVLINTARGPVVDAEALTSCLNDCLIAGACVDVFDIEPPLSKDMPLLQAKNLIATPHIGFATKEALVKRAKMVFENIQAFADGTPKNVV
ncbi:MAG TPA: NAD(P)-dependent oxidoreductase [Methanocorpusculum sp.]|nr:NAD(P)-dependent oxidoreductase [Methanocorpusculum sp.]HJJ77420.1 NAD(P)-dependent oxidoreductase [Methanocorpusculum sp.]